MKFLTTALCLTALACTAFGGEAKTYVLSRGDVTEVSAAPDLIPPTALPTAAQCHQDAAGNWICPATGQPIRSAAPTACYAGGCPCLPAKTPFDPATNCGTYACPANGGAGGCPCSGASIPQPMAGPGPVTHPRASFFLDRHPLHAVRSFFTNRPHLFGVLRFCR